MIPTKVIKIIFELECNNKTEDKALSHLAGISVYNAIMEFKKNKKTVEECINFFQKIEDIKSINNLLDGD